MTDSHQLVEAWLAEGATGDPPRELAVHATVCASCARRIGAFDSLAAVDVAAAGSPPPLTAPSPFWILLARGRAATTVAATVAAGILVVFGASQLIGSIGPPEAPEASQAAVAMTPGPDGKPVDGHGPQPAEEPSADPIASFVPLPSISPNEPPPAAPNAPFLAPNGVGYYTVGIRWTERASGGPVGKWELWRQTGSSGYWVKLGELPSSARSFINGGLTPGTTYGYRVRAVNVTGASGFSNIVSATTLVPPTAAPTPTASPTPTPEPTPTLEPTPTPDPTPTQCSDGLDNDADGYTDLADPRCGTSADDNESPADLHDCNDNIDNDFDGYTDFGSDPSCSSLFDNTESPVDPPPPPPDCNDNIDNDFDGYTDFGSDPSCSSLFDNTESPVDPPPPPPDCNDNIDNDFDGYTDFGSDPGCESLLDNDEFNLLPSIAPPSFPPSLPPSP